MNTLYMHMTLYESTHRLQYMCIYISSETFIMQSISSGCDISTSLHAVPHIQVQLDISNHRTNNCMPKECYLEQLKLR